MKEKALVLKMGLWLVVAAVFLLAVGFEAWAGQPSSGPAEEMSPAEFRMGPPLPMTGLPTEPRWTPMTGCEFVLPHPGTSWHAGYYHPAWGLPVAVVVPPRARYVAGYEWGVGGTQSTMIRHQFSRNYPGAGQIFRQQLLPSPRWPTHTDQFGLYAVRGPW